MQTTTPAVSLAYREEPRAADLARIRAIVEATGFFSTEESAVAVELADDRLAKGPASDYHFLFAEDAGEMLGYATYGPIALTHGSWDLYWIAVDPQAQGRGVGRALLAETERRIAHAGGRRLYVETSSRRQYEPTRAFYASCGYRLAATLDDFYAPGDGKMVFVKPLAGAAAAD
jgi:ribosomal protein S18 acetylase RimI-like enzyme